MDFSLLPRLRKWYFNSSLKKSLPRLLLANLILCLLVILWGAWVRLSESGAGCGQSWPLCHGKVLPLNSGSKTLTELLHRLTSGILGLTIAFSYLLSFLSTNDPQNPLRGSSFFCVIFTITEALIGAVLVKKGLVENNSSLMRAFTMSFHLINTLVLLYFINAAYFFSKQTLKTSYFKLPWQFHLTTFLFFLVATTGAMASLSHGLNPDPTFLIGLQNDFNPNSPWPTRLRIFHPILSLSLLGMLYWISKKQSFSIWGVYLQKILWPALIFALVNWALMSPSWGALIHLAFALSIWCIYVNLILGYQYRTN